MRHLYFYGLVLMLLCRSEYSTAQLAPYENPERASTLLSTLYSIRNNLNGFFSGNFYGLDLDQRWDTVAQHFRGNIPDYFYYPEIAQSGNTSFSIQELKINDNWSGRNITAVERLQYRQRELKKELMKDEGRKKVIYYIDTSGWIRARVETFMNPSYQGFYEERDSLNYTFHKDGSMIIEWKKTEHSSGSGYAGSIECGTLTSDLHQIYKHSEHRAVLDKWHNIISVATTSREKWDSCDNGGSKFNLRTISYDSLGRPAVVIDSSSAYPTRISEITYNYYRQPFRRFIDSVKDNPKYGSLMLPDISGWLNQQQPLTFVLVTKTWKYYLRNDRKRGQDICYPDSPSVRRDTVRYVMNERKQRVIAWDNKDESWLKKGTFALYRYGTDTQKRVTVKEIQFLPYTISGKDTAELAGTASLIIDTLQWGTYQVVALKTAEKAPYRPANYSSYRNGCIRTIINDDGAPHLYFHTKPTRTPSGRVENMIWISDNLIRCLWTSDYVYSLIYFKNEL